MRLTKRQSVILASGTIVLFFAAGKLLLERESERREPEPAPAVQSAETPAAPGSALTLGEFHRSETRDGKKLWEVRARSGQYFPEDKKAVLQNATLLFYKTDGNTVALESASAELFFDQASLTRASLSKDVKVVLNNEVTLTADAALYDSTARTVTIPGRVEIDSSTMRITGEELHAQIDSREFTLTRNVSTTIASRQEREEKKKR